MQLIKTKLSLISVEVTRVRFASEQPVLTVRYEGLHEVNVANIYCFTHPIMNVVVAQTEGLFQVDTICPPSRSLGLSRRPKSADQIFDFFNKS